MDFILKFLCFIVFISLAHLSFAYDSRDVPIPAALPMILCPTLYVNDDPVQSLEVNTTLTLSDCITVLSPQATYAYLTTTIIGAPVGVTIEHADSAVTCPADHPVPNIIVQHLDNHVRLVSSLRAVCCKTGVKTRIVMGWIQATECP